MKGPLTTLLIGCTSIIMPGPVGCNANDGTEPERRPRLLVTTDIGGDPDDQQSMIRLLVTSNTFELEGLVASASGTLGELDTAIVRTDLIRELIDAYGSVYHNLLLHHPGYESPEQLQLIVKAGNPHRGLGFIGEGHSTEGSEWIRKMILKGDNRPLNVAIWGGQTDVAQALFDLKMNQPKEQFESLTQRLRIYDINDQDKIYNWIHAQFPNLFYILASAPPGADRREGAYRGMYLGGDEALTSGEWIYQHLKTGHGSLGAVYPDKTWTAPNPHSCMKEGDTPSWFYFLDNGLQDPGDPGYGGWGGRFRRVEDNCFRDAIDRVDTVRSARVTVSRWRSAFQNDFAARMEWCVRPYDEANHHPVANLGGNATQDILEINVRTLEEVILDASGSSDPDGDQLVFKWWIYPEASNLPVTPRVEGSNSSIARLVVDETIKGKTIHIILEVSDNGRPRLTSYRRIIIKVR